MPSFGVSRSRVWSDAPVVVVCAPCVFASRLSLLYREFWYKLRKVAALTFCLICCYGRVKACIWRWSASGIVHQSGRSVASLGPVASAGVSVGGLLVYMTKNGGRGAFAPISALVVCS